jgi:hypothetical protein
MTFSFYIGSLRFATVVCFFTAAALQTVFRIELWLRIGFNADPDPAIQVNANPVPDPGPGL